MPRAISVKATGADNAPLLRLWDAFARLETEPSMAALMYPPHITIAIYEDVEVGTIISAMDRIFAGQRPLRLRFSELDCFQVPGFVVWARPDEDTILTGLHRRLNEVLDPSRCHDHYRPGNRVPHCTLAANVMAERKDEALTAIATPIEPFEVIFNVADCVEFPPVRVLHQIPL